MYSFNQEVIHDSKAMWDMALSFKCRYEYLKEQILKVQDDDYCISHKGELIFKYRDKAKFEKVVREYKKEICFIEQVFKHDFGYAREESYVKYLSEDKGE